LKAIVLSVLKKSEKWKIKRWVSMQITDVAKGKLTEVLKKYPGKNVRVYIRGFGWGGPRLGMTLDEPQTNEIATKVDGIDVLISDEARSLAEMSTIDYESGPYGEGFTIGMEVFSGFWCYSEIGRETPLMWH
jgi:Fe-S cluster assembly iron-binding protein IscA